LKDSSYRTLFGSAVGLITVITLSPADLAGEGESLAACDNHQVT
jgi:hypothetical protein